MRVAIEPATNAPLLGRTRHPEDCELTAAGVRCPGGARSAPWLLGGAVLVAGAVLSALTLRTNRQGQITERFTRAVDQLGSEKTAVCVGGIYALERIARDSNRDHGPIMEVLTAFVRANSPAPPADEPAPGATDDVRAPAAVQAIMAVLARRVQAHEPEGGPPIVLSGTNLRGVMLGSGHLEGVFLDGADLGGAALVGVHLEGAVLTDADLRQADLSGAELTGAKLSGADLSTALLTGTRLEGATYDSKTRWPGDFDPKAAGADSLELE